MKFIPLLTLVALTITATANADQFKCAEKSADALQKKRDQYAVFVTTLGRITDPKVVGKSDFAQAVRVSVLSRNPRQTGSKFKLDRPTFKAIAKSEDVMYQINSWKRDGFALMIFMDELNETAMSLRGIKGSIQMNCHATQMDANR